eukprot:SAG31_NODE_24201_length_486_cov_4.943152_1_plen_48_part_10
MAMGQLRSRMRAYLNLQVALRRRTAVRRPMADPAIRLHRARGAAARAA